jgi:hypothetical protein
MAERLVPGKHVGELEVAAREFVQDLVTAAHPANVPPTVQRRPVFSLHATAQKDGGRRGLARDDKRESAVMV